MSKERFKKEFENLKINRFTVILASAVFVLSLVIAIIVGNNPNALSRNWFWAFAGVMCLGQGAVLYIHGLSAKASNICILSGIILFALGVLWFVTDIICNDRIHDQVGSGWWIGLIAGVAIGAVLYLIPVLIKKYINKKR